MMQKFSDLTLLTITFPTVYETDISAVAYVVFDSSSSVIITKHRHRKLQNMEMDSLVNDLLVQHPGCIK